MPQTSPVIDYSPQNVKALLSTGHNKGEVAKLTGVSRQSIWALTKKLEAQQKEKESILKLLPDLMIDSISLGKQALDRALGWYVELDDDSFGALPWSAKRGFGDLAINAIGMSFDKYRIETGQFVPNSSSLPIQEVTNNIQVNIGKLQALGVDVADLVGKIAGDVRDKAVGLGSQSLNVGDKLGSNVSS